MRVQLAVLSALFFVTALVAGVSANCSAAATKDLTKQVPSPSFTILEKWVINGAWNVSIEEGTHLAVVFMGTDSGSVTADLSSNNTTLSTTFSIAAGGNTPSDGIVDAPRPKRIRVSSASSNSILGLNSIITLVTGLLFARSNKRGLIVLAVVFVLLSITMETAMAKTQASECPEAYIKATIPRGTVRKICFNGETDCICGPGFSGITCDPVTEVPVAAPTAPVAAPVTPPVTPPVKAPVAAPVTPPVAAPVTPPVTPPVAAPVTPPVTPPVAAPVTPPVTPPVAAPVTPPVTPPVAAPVTPPVAPPVTPPVTPPIAPPVAPPVDPPVTPPVTPVAPPVDPPTAVPVAAPTVPPPV